MAGLVHVAYRVIILCEKNELRQQKKTIIRTLTFTQYGVAVIVVKAAEANRLYKPMIYTVFGQKTNHYVLQHISTLLNRFVGNLSQL